MCGIVGYYNKNGITQDGVYRLTKIFHNSTIRGKHSFGISYLENGELVTKKSLTFRGILNELQMVKNTTLLIGHTRYSTSGDYQIIENNQPLIKNGVALVFNGIIIQKDKSEFIKIFPGVYETANDGEIFINYLLENLEVEKFFTKISCSFSGLRIKDGNMCAFTNGKRPARIKEQGNDVFIASTQDIMLRSGIMDSKALDINKLYKWKG